MNDEEYIYDEITGRRKRRNLFNRKKLNSEELDELMNGDGNGSLGQV